jgi:lipid-A-disaccharide synthase
MPRIVIIAGEASGDQLGASLIRAARQKNPDIEFEGVAGPAMRAEGCRAWFDCADLAVMGLFEVLLHLPRLLRIRREIKRRLRVDPPDVLVGIDAPDFNLPVERVARSQGIPTVQYVCPSVWAWRQGRVKILRASCDRVLCLLPFESDFLKQHGVDGDFVGHPLADEIPDFVDKSEARRHLGVDAGTVIALLPGSREGEVTRLGPAFAQAARWIAGRVKGVVFLVPAATPALGKVFDAALRRYAPDCETRIIDGRAREVLAAADVALVASGTATLETMLINRPMVMAYKVAPLTYWVARLLRLVRVPHFSLPNLLAGRPLIRELIQSEATPEAMGAGVLELLESPEKCEELEKIFGSLHDQLRRSASQRAADAVIETGGLNS